MTVSKLMYAWCQLVSLYTKLPVKQFELPYISHSANVFEITYLT